jgi:hypothetical protein
MEFLEKDLENIIWEASDEQLEKAGLEVRGKRFRQLKIGQYGIADFVTVERQSIYSEYHYIQTGKCRPIDNYLLITIYELKKDKIGISAFLQAIRYAKGIQSYLTNQRDFSDFVFKIVLIGSNVDTSGSVCFLPDLISVCPTSDERITHKGSIESIAFYTYHISIDGLNFEYHSNYKLINEGF